MKKSSIFLAATLAAGIGLTVLPSTADAGGRERWRSCGGHAYEGCDGIEHGPYARHRGYYKPRGYHGGGYAAPCGGRCGAYGYRPPRQKTEVSYSRVHVGQLYVNRRTGERFFVPSR